MAYRILKSVLYFTLDFIAKRVESIDTLAVERRIHRFYFVGSVITSSHRYHCESYANMGIIPHTPTRKPVSFTISDPSLAL